MPSTLDVYLARSTLSQDDAKIIQELAKYIQVFADITQADVFIDCPVEEKKTALVVAQASPSTAKSLYKSSVVGQMALGQNEPAVLFSLTSGKSVIGSRGVSQEQTVMQQSVVPIKNPEGRTIGTLIMEQDISEKIEQEKNVEMLIETTEHLSETLLQIAMSESQVLSLMHEGIILFDNRQIVTYANARSYELMKEIGFEIPIKGQQIERFFEGMFSKENFQANGGMIFEELQFGKKSLLVKAVSIYREMNAVGGVILIRDITEIKEKEKQLMIKSAVIKEIHHRVKNNLQTISSLLRLQMRRSASTELEKVYRESINRINSIAIIHEYLAQDGIEVIDFKEIVEKIAKTIISSMLRLEQSIQITIDAESSVHLSSEKATSLALVVTELIQNSVIHGFGDNQSGLITIRIERHEQEMVIQVIDNGVGIGYNGAQVQNGHLGLKIVETLVSEDLSGVLHFQDTGHGTEVTIRYPVEVRGEECELQNPLGR